MSQEPIASQTKTEGDPKPAVDSITADPMVGTTGAKPAVDSMGARPAVGLIGAIGGGKSTVAQLLAAKGAAVLDADRLGHSVLAEPAIIATLVERFGEAILAEGKADTIDRPVLGRMVFADPEALKDLNAIVHPRMRQRMLEWMGEVKVVPLKVLDAAILQEAGWDDLCWHVLFIDAPRAVRLERLATSRGWNEEQLDRREASQWPLDRKRAGADSIVENDGSQDQLCAKINEWWEHITAKGRERLHDTRVN